MRALAALTPGLLATRSAPAQSSPQPPREIRNPRGDVIDQRLPNGKIQRDEILRDDYAHNVKDAAELVQLTSAFQLELEKSDRFVLSLDLLKKLDDIEKITKRIRSRMKR
ncbi:MAG TPA: hypothetical protein VNH18_34060 [Bryobacteraceae bacterium]|nr:hypothetical protein [Bryobacteraceae bacterium]